MPLTRSTALQICPKPMKSALILRLLMLAGGFALALFPWFAPVAPPEERSVRIEASSFAYSPEQIWLNVGDRVTLELVSMDVVHGLYLDGYDISMTSDPGQTSRLTFTADRAGSFRFRCNVTCGAMHPFMIGKFNVGRNHTLYLAAGMSISATAAFLLIRPRQVTS